jgi:hypothetical protein
MFSKIRPRTLLIAFTVAGCYGGYPPGFQGLTVGGQPHGPAISGASMPAVNSLQVPICEVLVTAPAGGKSFANDGTGGQVFLSPGEQKDVFAPALSDLTKAVSSAELEKEGKQMSVTAYGCKKEAYDWTVDESMTLSQQTVDFDRSRKLVLH